MSDFDSIEVLMEQGNRLRFVTFAKTVFRFINNVMSQKLNQFFLSLVVLEACLILICNSSFRATAATRMNNASSRSHAIFTIKFTQVNVLSACV